MSTKEEMNVDRSLGYKLKKTQHLLRLKMDEALNRLDLTTPQYAVLAQLEFESGISNAELARRSFITAQTMHAIVANLERRNLVQRKNDAKHGRILCTELTRPGREIVKKAHDIISDVESAMLINISDKQKAQLELLLLKCFNNMS